MRMYLCHLCRQEVDAVYADEVETLKGKVIKRWLCERHYFNKRNRDLREIIDAKRDL